MEQAISRYRDATQAAKAAYAAECAELNTALLNADERQRLQSTARTDHYCDQVAALDALRAAAKQHGWIVSHGFVVAPSGAVTNL